MKINFDLQLLDVLDRHLPKNTFKNTLLLSLDKANSGATGTEKMKVYGLIKKVKQESEDFTIEEMAQIKKAVGDMCAPTIVAQIWESLENA